MSCLHARRHDTDIPPPPPFPASGMAAALSSLSHTHSALKSTCLLLPTTMFPALDLWRCSPPLLASSTLACSPMLEAPVLGSLWLPRMGRRCHRKRQEQGLPPQYLPLQKRRSVKKSPPMQVPLTLQRKQRLVAGTPEPDPSSSPFLFKKCCKQVSNPHCLKIFSWMTVSIKTHTLYSIYAQSTQLI